MSDKKQKETSEPNAAIASKRSSDSLAFVAPGDDPALDTLIASLRADCDEGDPLFVNYGQRTRGVDSARPRVVRGRGRRGQPTEGGALGGVRSVKGGAAGSARERNAPEGRAATTPRWMKIALVLLFVPAFTLIVGLLLTKKTGGSGLTGASEAPLASMPSTASSAAASAPTAGAASAANASGSAPEPMAARPIPSAQASAQAIAVPSAQASAQAIAVPSASPSASPSGTRPALSAKPRTSSGRAPAPAPASDFID